MIFPMFMPSRWRGPRQAVDAQPASDADGDLATAATDSGEPEEWQEELPLVGTVVGGVSPVADGRPIADGVRRVDTSHVTGASRALRNTSSFRLATGAQPRATGSFRAAQYSKPLNWPDQQATDE
jgi:hypothetical protein